MSLLPHPDTVDLWQWDLDDPCWDCHDRILNAQERERASRFHGTVLQQRSRRCKTVLRLILARYREGAAADIVFTYGDFGKPGLAGSAVHFNLSHCDHLTLLAVSTAPLGVDIEAQRRPRVEIDSLLDWVCHPEEKRRLLSLGETERCTAFYRLWTQKEAYCKALGDGLQKSLTAIQLIAWTGDTFRVLDAEGSQAVGLFVHSLPAPPGYLASLCTPVSAPLLRPASILPDGDITLETNMPRPSVQADSLSSCNWYR